MDESSIKRKPEIRVFAGPNGSGKSSITLDQYILHPYINADDIKRQYGCTDLEAAEIATTMRENSVDQGASFTFETVLSTERNLLLLERAKQKDYFIRCSFVLTADPMLNVERVAYRVRMGGHDVPREKIISRYYKSIGFLPRLCAVCDRLNIYDNTLTHPHRIFKKRGEIFQLYPSPVWEDEEVINLVFLGHK